MTNPKKWAIHLACYLIAMIGMSALNEFHPSVLQRKQVAAAVAESSEPAWQPTSVIRLDNDNPYATPGQEFDGKLYLYEDLKFALWSPRVNSDRTFLFYSLSKDSKGTYTLSGKGVATIKANGEYDITERERIAPLSIPALEDGAPVMETSMGTTYKKYLVRLAESTPAQYRASIVKEAYQRTTGALQAPEQPDGQKQAVEKYQQKQSRLQHKSVVFYTLLGITILSLLMAIGLVNMNDDELDLTPRAKYQMDAEGNVTLSQEFQPLPGILKVFNIAALAITAFVCVCLSVPDLYLTAETCLFAGFFEGAGAIIMLAVTIGSLAVSFWIMSRAIRQAEDADTEKGIWLTLVELAAVALLNIYAIVLWGPVSFVVVIALNLWLAMPDTLIAYSTGKTKTMLHWLIPLDIMLKWLYSSLFLLIMLAVYIFHMFLQGKVKADAAADLAAKRRRAQEGNSFIVTDSEGHAVHMTRIGNSDNFTCGNGNTYERNAGGSFTKLP